MTSFPFGTSPARPAPSAAGVVTLLRLPEGEDSVPVLPGWGDLTGRVGGSGQPWLEPLKSSSQVPGVRGTGGTGQSGVCSWTSPGDLEFPE